MSVFSYCHTAPEIHDSARTRMTVDYKDFSEVCEQML